MNDQQNDIEIKYNEALDYLYSFIDYSLQRSFRYAPEKFNLERMRSLVKELGNPQQAYPSIHVAGTKGKGSVSALCASALREAGYQVGFYSSPHLHDYAERIQINGKPIPHADLVRIIAEIKPFVEAIPELTTFEITTALAFYYFAQQKVTAAVFEVGLGGRLDATNVILPEVSVITSLSYDHTHLLGNTLAEIAGEKAGIIKPGVPAVFSPQKDEARLVLEKIAAERSSPVIQVGKDYLYSPQAHSLDGQAIYIWERSEQDKADAFLDQRNTDSWKPRYLNISLLGQHQAENAATAYAALKTADRYGLSIDEVAIEKGFGSVSWPGRFEILRPEPPVIVDSAHNRDSALKLRLTLDEYFPGRPVVLIFGASEDKDIEGMFTELLPRVQNVIATKSVHPRAIDPHKLVELAHKHGCGARIAQDIETALSEALHLAGGEAIVLAAGSIFVAAAVREVWFARNPEQLKML